MKKKGIDIEENNGCLLVTSHRLNADRYAYVWHNGRNQRAHRLVYEECFGEIPYGLVVRHKCDVRNCVNPEHLELGTPRDNMQDAILRNRNALGTGNPRSVLNEEKVRTIRLMAECGLTTKEISRSLNVGFYAVRSVKRGRTWKHVD